MAAFARRLSVGDARRPAPKDARPRAVRMPALFLIGARRCRGLFVFLSGAALRRRGMRADCSFSIGARRGGAAACVRLVRFRSGGVATSTVARGSSATATQVRVDLRRAAQRRLGPLRAPGTREAPGADDAGRGSLRVVAVPPPCGNRPPFFEGTTPAVQRCKAHHKRSSPLRARPAQVPRGRVPPRGGGGCEDRERPRRVLRGGPLH